MPTSENITTGASPVSASDVAVTYITSGGSGDEMVLLHQLDGIAADRIGSRHTFVFATQANESDRVGINIVPTGGGSQQAMPTYDIAGNIASMMDDGVVWLTWQDEPVSFLWTGTRGWMLDDTTQSGEGVRAPVVQFPNPLGKPDGSTLQIVSGVPTWVAPAE